ncbi:MAG: phosphopyruvate hydratase [Thermoplasmataceae archaeon]
MSKIRKLKAREVLDSRGNPTVEAEIHTEDGVFRAIVPSGASTGIHEAVELRDNDPSRYNGKGVLNVVKTVNTTLSDLVVGMDPVNQLEIDRKMIDLDGTENKAKLGANAILAVSMAVARAGAASEKLPLYRYIAKIAGVRDFVMPVPCFNVINGGVHAGNKLAPQEFMLVPVGAGNVHEAVRMGSEIYHMLKDEITKKYGKRDTNVGDEGGFAPNIADANECLSLLTKSIEASGYAGRVRIGIDLAASEFFSGGRYDLNFKDPALKGKFMKTGDEMIEMYQGFVDNYDIAFIEDPFAQDDWDNFTKITGALGERIEIIGDDLLVTNIKRIDEAARRKAVNGLLLKMNQIGSISETIEACKKAQGNKWGVLVSHRSGDTDDPFIADLSVGLRAGHIKSGAPCRSERLAKYNQLMRIEEDLDYKCTFAGTNFRNP